jgi:hypothetical protein
VAISRDRRQTWARLGAKARLFELRQEASEILRIYPEFRREAGRLNTSPGKRRRRHISPEARAAMSDGMRKYWAKRRTQSGRKRQAKTA